LSHSTLPALLFVEVVSYIITWKVMSSVLNSAASVNTSRSVCGQNNCPGKSSLSGLWESETQKAKALLNLLAESN
jgi:nucleoside diphosphate kinase